MTERLTLEEFTEKYGVPKLGAKKKPNRAAAQQRKLALLVLIKRLERERGLPPDGIVQEYHFAKDRERNYRMDLAIPDKKIALEIHGGAFVKRVTGGTGGAHHTIEGRARDMAKGNLAAVMGWIVIEVSPNEVADGTAYHWLAEALDLRDSAI